jgi:hypothetical protein
MRRAIEVFPLPGGAKQHNVMVFGYIIAGGKSRNQVFVQIPVRGYSISSTQAQDSEENRLVLSVSSDDCFSGTQSMSTIQAKAVFKGHCLGTAVRSAAL